LGRFAYRLSVDLPGHLLDFQNDKLGRLERRESDDDIDNAEIDVALRRGFLVAFDKVVPERKVLLPL
jgi:hypothetical protein